jgi:hypothetical protein
MAVQPLREVAQKGVAGVGDDAFDDKLLARDPQ